VATDVEQGESVARLTVAGQSYNFKTAQPKTTEPLRHPEPDRDSAPISRRPDDTLHPAGEWQGVVPATGCELPSALFSNMLARRDVPHDSRTSECACLPPRHLMFASADVTSCETEHRHAAVAIEEWLRHR
jgi:hypothetical protein